MSHERLVLFQHPFRMMIVGPSCSGKTWFVTKMFEKCLMSTLPEEVFVFCGEQAQDEYRKWNSILAGREYGGVTAEYYTNLPDAKWYASLQQRVNRESEGGKKPRLVIIDDMMEEAANSSTVANLFTRGSHHQNMSIILLMQNLFPKGKQMTTISRNAEYLVLMKNTRDQLQVEMLAKQMYPGRKEVLMNAWLLATREPFSHLIVDTRQDTPDALRMRSVNKKRTSVFMPEETFKSLPKKGYKRVKQSDA
jgi:hypothetical protein